MNNPSIPITNWDTVLYENKHAFVWQYGEDLLQLLNPQRGEQILDLGCGTGQLTEKIRNFGAEVMGIDDAPTMIKKAKHNYPHLKFDVGDAKSFQVEKPLDAVFSNAVLHWIPEAEAVIGCVHQALKVGGRFIAEFGGKGNVQEITTAIAFALNSMGVEKQSPWYFPSIGEYASLLENQGFEVRYATLFPRPTPLAEGDAGMRNWIQMFAGSFLLGLSQEEQKRVIQIAEERLKPSLYSDGSWTADYRRIRIVVIKTGA
jgi:trans-aconitate methyltransferase